MVQPIKASRAGGQLCRVNIAIHPKSWFVLVSAACLASQNKHPNGAIFMAPSQLSQLYQVRTRSGKSMQKFCEFVMFIETIEVGAWECHLMVLIGHS
jgi:hypothetical protein